MKNMFILALAALFKAHAQERITMNRFGTIVTDLTSENQCKAKGHTHYEYLVKIECRNHLTAQGFLIDNLKVNKTIQDCFSKMNSCEMLCVQFANSLEDLFHKENVPVCSVEVSVKPILPEGIAKDYAEFTLKRIYE